MTSSRIQSLQAIQILDSRGLPTIQVTISVTNPSDPIDNKVYWAKSSVPSGASTGTWEALELRDNDANNYGGKGVSMAINNINTIIAPKLIGNRYDRAMQVDELMIELDGTPNESKLGANSILAVSNAVHRAMAKVSKQELFQYLRSEYFDQFGEDYQMPRLMSNIINGGAHADSGLDVQEFMVVPNSGDLRTDVKIASEIYHRLKADLHKAGQITSLGDEGGFAPKLATSVEALDLITRSVQEAGYAKQCNIALDVASSELLDSQTQMYRIDGQNLSAGELVKHYNSLITKYDIISIEDGLAEDDIAGWQIAKRELTADLWQIGDDLFVTNSKRFQELALGSNVANGILIKPNQIGTILETVQVINLALSNNYITAISHRSGETTDTLISDLAVACNSKFIKLGAPARGERVVKYNRLLEIAELI
ncbi:MAG: phosphopyruvate hydratase [Candidatus Parcubacteria bacterium]|nr:phosphopyruvate hydratase [Candidatus Paceibacterota bacterium]